MKNALLFIFLLFSSINLFSQEVIELDKSRAKEEYCMLLVSQKFLSTKVKIDVDFGQKMSFWKNTTAVKDIEGKRKEFNSVIDALNYMSSEGWEFVNAYSLTVSDQNVLHYVLKRNLKNNSKEN